MAIPKNNPSTPSSDYRAAEAYLAMIAAITGGVKTMREAGTAFLPQFQAEQLDDYKRRLKNARLTNVFMDIVDNLSMRPFQEPTKLSDQSTQRFKDFAEDVDARGDDLNTFAAKSFRSALEDGITWVLVDHTKDVPEGASVAQEREMGARPYWTQYKAADVLAVYSERINGVERIVEARLREVSVERDGFDEKTIERVRVFRHYKDMTMPEWEVWRKKESVASSQGGGASEWELEEGPTALSIDVIPLVPIVFGQRDGNGWRVDPPLRDAAYLQIELYQQENGLKNVRTLTAFPMLAGNGMEPELGEDGSPKPIAVGPNAVLFGGRSADGSAAGSWTFVEPSGQSLTFLREDIKDTIRELRELGRQPLTAQSGNLTVITTAVAAQKGNTAIQAWAGMLSSALVSCFEMTAKWLNLADFTAEVMVYDDFDLGLDDQSAEQVFKLMTADPPLISREAGLQEYKRRGILGPQYDPEEDLELIEESLDDRPEPEPAPPPPPEPQPGPQELPEAA